MHSSIMRSAARYLAAFFVIALLAGCGSDQVPPDAATTSVPPDVATAPPMEFGTGWFDQEVGGPTGTFRWSNGEALLLIGAEGSARPPLWLQFKATSLSMPRDLTVTAEGLQLAEVRAIPADFEFVDVRVSLPPGDGVLRVEMDTRPGATPAAAVTPIDDRELAIAVAGLELVSP